MEKKEINEIRKCFQRNDCRIDRLRGCYVNEEKEKISSIRELFLALEDEEMSRYCELFRKALSGKIGRNLFNLSFPLAEEAEGGRQHFLLRLLDSELKDEELVQEFFDRVIENYQEAGKYLILLVRGVYDIPGRTSDGLGLGDASEEVYSFLLCCICPVALLREGLCYDKAAGSFLSRSDDWAVQKPDSAFLFPAFRERSTDLHEALYYAKKPAERHEEIPGELLGAPLPRAEKEEQLLFRDLVEDVLGRKCDFDSVKGISESLSQLVEEGKEREESALLDRESMKKLLRENGAEEERLLRFEKSYEEKTGGDDSPLLAENILPGKELRLKSKLLKLNISSELSELLESRIIDGREYLLLPISDDLELNGIRLRQKLSED